MLNILYILHMDMFFECTKIEKSSEQQTFACPIFYSNC